MAAQVDVRQTVLTCLDEFLRSSGRTDLAIHDRTSLLNDVGMSSDEGIDFVIDLCEAFEVDLPKDFNPIVHDDGRRGRSVGEVVDAVAAIVSTEETAR